jgi:type IV fimbrial biogenesis protein FimT
VSLLEALLATSIAGVLTTAAVPAMTDTLARQQLGAGVSDLFASFNLARSEAIRRGAPVAVAPADAENWSSGCKVFADRDDDGVQDAGEETLAERPPIAAGLAIQPFFGATYTGKVLSYSSQGRLHRPGKNLLVVGRLVATHHGLVRSLCFASLGMRIVASSSCE